MSPVHGAVRDGRSQLLPLHVRVSGEWPLPAGTAPRRPISCAPGCGRSLAWDLAIRVVSVGECTNTTVQWLVGAVAANRRQKASLLRCLRCIDMIWFVGEPISRVGVRASLPRSIELRVLKSDVWSGMTSKCWRFCHTKRHTAQLTDQSQYRDRSISECAAFPLARVGFRRCRGRCLRFSGDFPAGTGGRCRRLRSVTDRSVPNVASCCRKSTPTMMMMLCHAGGLVRSSLLSPYVRLPVH